MLKYARGVRCYGFFMAVEGVKERYGFSLGRVFDFYMLKSQKTPDSSLSTSSSTAMRSGEIAERGNLSRSPLAPGATRSARARATN